MDAMISATLMGEELAVIDDELILKCAASERKALEAEKPHHGDFAEVEQEEISISKLTSLTLSFQNLRVIENLLTLDRLRVLRLDNNRIEAITGLAHLTALEWLDLSFNNISKIENLETLTNLTDLTLFNNNIQTVEGLDTLTKLQVLSLGNNRLSTLDGLMYLRQFKSLAVVNLDGNPVAEEPDYRSTMLAFMDSIQYLDYSRVEASERTHAQEIHQHQLLDFEEDAQNAAMSAARDEETRERDEKLRVAGLKRVDDILETMLDADVDGKRLEILPGVDDLASQLREHIRSMADEAETIGFEEHEKLAAEEAVMKKSLNAIVAAADKKALEHVQKFEKTKKHALRDAHASGDGDVFAAIDSLRKLASELRDTLTELELSLMEDVNQVINTFESTYSDMSSARRDNFDAFFRGAEDAVNEHKEMVMHIVNNLTERVKEDEGASGLDEEAVELLSDKDTVVNLVGSSNDFHIGRLLETEDKVRGDEKERQTAAIEGVREQQKLRNRERIVEIAALEEHINGLLDEAEADERAAEEEERDDVMGGAGGLRSTLGTTS